MMYTLEQVQAAMNLAIDWIEHEVEESDNLTQMREESESGMALLLNVALHALEHPGSDLDDAVKAGWDDTQSVDEVLELVAF